MAENNNEAEQWMRLHPALDFTAEHAFVGQRYRSALRENSRLCLIRDDEEIIQCSPESLEIERIELAHDCYNFEPSWSDESIRRFSNGEAEVSDKNQLFNNIKAQFMAYIELPNIKFYDFLTLWTIGTYFFPLFNTYPYVNLQGLMQSGKTKLLTLCSCLSFNAALSANMTTACIYRLVESNRCSLLIDEAEGFFNRNRDEDFRNILLNGYRKGLRAFRNERDEKGNFIPVGYEVYGPKMLANIEGIEDVLASRCVTIRMQRSSNREIMNAEVFIDDPVWQQLRDSLYVFMMKNWKQVRQAYLGIHHDDALIGREWELWKPILSLAHFFDDKLLGNLYLLSGETASERKSERADTPEHVLVEILHSEIDEDGYYPLRGIKDCMAGYFSDEHWLTERSVGRMLRKLGFTTWRRVSYGTEYFFNVSQVRDLAQRLGIGEDGVDSEGSEDAGKEGAEAKTQRKEALEERVIVHENRKN